ncbi:DUF2867 domain-containing protein [Pseudomonas sp. OA65]|uniref:DUF2867 domain-containing protein n=1 Tax=Pseudomonas sp. OA65 TaxID=2818431 RepID=UPI001A9DBBB7|nr:DUF2867 domain-containing protein [Pseudomonas sp. OA65]MBO1540739.1 DUF2867 domain-containing protein [Pseudomonas sp. OA65]
MKHGAASGAFQATKTLPHKDSLCRHRFDNAFYADCFSRQTASAPFDSALSCYLSMTAKAPGWVNGLLRLRDRMVVPLGMNPTHGFRAQELDSPIVTKGDRLDFFTVVSISPRELELQLDDRHFTVSISIYLSAHPPAQRLYITSIVNPVSRVGKVYVSLITPFHRAVVKTLLNRLG